MFILSLENWIEQERTARSQAVLTLEYRLPNQPFTAHVANESYNEMPYVHSKIHSVC